MYSKLEMELFVCNLNNDAQEKHFLTNEAQEICFISQLEVNISGWIKVQNSQSLLPRILKNFWVDPTHQPPAKNKIR